MTPDQYLQNILLKHHVDTGPQSPVLRARATLSPVLTQWAGQHLLAITPSGSFAKGTAVRSGTDLDLFLSLSSTTTETLQEIHDKLIKKLVTAGYTPHRQTMSIGIRMKLTDGSVYDVDLVPAKKRADHTGDHSLYHRKSGTARKTNIQHHINEVSGSGRLQEIKILKLWRNQHKIELPSFYLELTTITALAGRPYGDLATNVAHVFNYLRYKFPNARVPDPAVPTNAVSDDLTPAEKIQVRNAAIKAITATNWNQIVV